MKKELDCEDIENLLDLENEKIKRLYMSWDKGDCSVIGLIEILLLQEIENHKKENGSYYNTDYDQIILRYKIN
jgi:hypothetical protein